MEGTGWQWDRRGLGTGDKGREDEQPGRGQGAGQDSEVTGMRMEGTGTGMAGTGWGWRGQGQDGDKDGGDRRGLGTGDNVRGDGAVREGTGWGQRSRGQALGDPRESEGPVSPRGDGDRRWQAGMGPTGTCCSRVAREVTWGHPLAQGGTEEGGRRQERVTPGWGGRR